MAFTEFCSRSGGSNLNSGSRRGDSSVPDTFPDLIFTAGNWTQSTGVFTPSSGDPISLGVQVGDFASVYPVGSTITPFIGRITAVSSTTITVSLTAKSGTAPTDGTGDRTLRIGGAWAGPSGSTNFPIGFVQSTMTNSSGDQVRVNFKNDQVYSITSTLIQNQNNAMDWWGFSSEYGDGGLFVIEGPTTGSSFVLFNLTGNGSRLAYVDLSHNGSTGSSAGLNISGECVLFRVVVHDVRGEGIKMDLPNIWAIECEAYACNQSNTANMGGFNIGSTGTSHFIRCKSHNNLGSNSFGFNLARSGSATNCIAYNNGASGFVIGAASGFARLHSCDSFNNTGDGIRLGNTQQGLYHIENCNLVKNGGYGINGSGTSTRVGNILNCSFGSGMMANTSGSTNGLKGMIEIDSILLPVDVTPWVSPSTGDFRINLNEVKGTGRGSYLETAVGQTGTVGYPDRGAAQHQDLSLIKKVKRAGMIMKM